MSTIKWTLAIFVFASCIQGCCDDEVASNDINSETGSCLVLKGNEFRELALDKEPEYLDGGQQCLLECLYSLIRYPDLAKENGTQGGMVIQFVISTSGEVQELEILEDIGDGFSEEAHRVFEECMTGVPYQADKLDLKSYVGLKRQDLRCKLA